MSHSKIFQRNRALGYVSNHIPLVTRYIERRKENLIVTCVGRNFHTYGCSHFTLLSVSGMHPGDINCLAADTYHIYTSSENEVFAWRRGCELKHTYKGHDALVHLLLPFGPHLISVDENSHVKVWDIKAEDIALELDFNNDFFKIAAMMHPATYVNQILFASEQGQMQLWDIKSSQLIYTFPGWSCAISVVEQAPAIDVVAVGLADGRIILHNLRCNKSLFQFVQDWGFVTSISFRTDGHTIMATGTLQGHIVLWNLEKRKVESQILNAHFGSVTGLKCLPNEPLLVSSSPDNSLKLWIFDMADGAGRLLRIREGHAEPPRYLRFYGSDGNNILTAGGDSSLRIFSTITETFNKSLGRASFNRKVSKKKGRLVEDPLIMPPMREIAAEQTREKDWDNIVASHEGLGVVTTWSYDKLKMGEHKLLPENLKYNSNVTATCLCLTKCGNFVTVGYNTGHVERFNIQSGIHRATYGDAQGAHKGPVTGVYVDSLNQYVISAGRDTFLKFWPFKPKKGVRPKVIKLNESVEWLRNHTESSLIALALQDYSIIIIDVDTKNILRSFHGHTGRLMDATFSPDSRWLVTASVDRTIRTWDIPSGFLIDIFEVSEACVSLHFSPTGEYLATAHTCSMGLYLWANRTLFSHVSLKAVRPDEPIIQISLPGTLVKTKKGVEVNETALESEDEDAVYTSPEQLSPELITMSSLATSRWMNLLNIDLVKKRNKPKEPPKKPEAAPFFLPTIPDLETRFDFSDVQKEGESQRLLIHPNFQSLTTIGRMLHQSIDVKNFDDIIAKLKTMGPSSIDFEIQSLSLDLHLSTPIMRQFFKMIKYMLEKKKDFELAQAYLALFVKVHGDTIVRTKDLSECIDEVQKAQTESWTILKEQLSYNLSVVQHLRKTLERTQ